MSNPDDFALRFRGIGSTSDGTWDDFEGESGGDDVDDIMGDAKPADDKPDDDFIQKF